MMKILLPSSSVLHSDSNERRTVFCQRRDRLKCMQRYERCPFPSLRVVLVWLFTLAVIAAIGVTLWLTRNIPFGAHCGNAHRALLGVLIVIVIGGICMPVYYKYIQDDLVVKEWHQKHQALMDARSRQELSIISRNRERKRSVVASKRFSLALKVSTLILILVVALGYYYLWGEENQCMDETLWIVKGWFIALLAVAIAVTALMLSAMFRAVKEKRLLKTRNNLDEDEARYNGSIGLDGREGASTQESRIAPPLSPSTPSSVALPPAYTGLTPLGRVSLDQPRRAPDQRERAVDEREHVVDEREHVVDEREHVLEQRERAVRQRERAQIEKALAELDQQEQQFHQDRTDHSQAGYGGYSGASGTGAYC
ncbi:hypothetical protein BGZ58_001048 [Dissophora ornata]|nr:hypothetical protein BGZ58_001048 [Dissophora ornata]